MGAPLQLGGQRIGLLTAVAPSYLSFKGTWFWLCRCSCDRLRTFEAARLKARWVRGCEICKPLRSRTLGAAGGPLDRYNRR
jgi:hypothetical protein